jgi:hypothetical protein
MQVLMDVEKISSNFTKLYISVGRVFDFLNNYWVSIFGNKLKLKNYQVWVFEKNQN